MAAKNELPIPWNNWTRGGILTVLLGVISMQQVWIHNKDVTIKEMEQEKTTWLNKFIDEKIEKAKQEKIIPKVDEVKTIADSVKIEIAKP